MSAEVEWVADGHVAAYRADQTPRWVWLCPWIETTPADWHQRPQSEVPPCRRGYDLRGILVERVVSPHCMVAPWFNAEGVIRCLVWADGLPGQLPEDGIAEIPAEYAWLRGHYRWRPVQAAAA